MADQKITDFAALTGAGAATGDLVEVVDVSDTTMHATGTNVKMTLGQLAVAIATLLPDATDFVLGTTTGSKIGTATSQKLGFYNATPVTQPSAYTQTYSTADKTHAAATATTLTAASGTADGTVADVTASFDQTILNNNFQDLATAVNALIVDVADVKQLVNSVIDDLQSLGLVG